MGLISRELANHMFACSYQSTDSTLQDLIRLEKLTVSRCERAGQQRLSAHKMAPPSTFGVDVKFKPASDEGRRRTKFK